MLLHCPKRFSSRCSYWLSPVPCSYSLFAFLLPPPCTDIPVLHTSILCPSFLLLLGFFFSPLDSTNALLIHQPFAPRSTVSPAAISSLTLCLLHRLCKHCRVAFAQDRRGCFLTCPCPTCPPFLCNLSQDFSILAADFPARV